MLNMIRPTLSTLPLHGTCLLPGSEQAAQQNKTEHCLSFFGDVCRQWSL